MKTFSIKIILLLIGVFTLSSCLFDEDARDYGKGPIVVQFPSASDSENFLQDGVATSYEYEIPIEYYGGDNYEPLDEDVTVTVAVSDDSEATEGVEFSISDKTVTIPAGSRTANLVVTVYVNELDATDPKAMVLEIVSSSQTVSSNKNVTSITLQAICPSDLAGSYVYSNGSGRDVTLTSTGTGTYSVSTDNYFRGYYPLYISDVCGTLTITGGYLQDNFGIAVSGYGSVDDDTGVITLVYTADGYFSERTMIMTPQ